MQAHIENEILEAFGYINKKYPYEACCFPAYYVIDGRGVALGFVKWLIHVNKSWFVSGSQFISTDGFLFEKVLYLYYDKPKNQLNRCHSIYVDKDDLLKKGNTPTNYSFGETIASLLNHALNFNEKNCLGCKEIGRAHV